MGVPLLPLRPLMVTLLLCASMIVSEEMVIGAVRVIEQSCMNVTSPPVLNASRSACSVQSATSPSARTNTVESRTSPDTRSDRKPRAGGHNPFGIERSGDSWLSITDMLSRSLRFFEFFLLAFLFGSHSFG